MGAAAVVTVSTLSTSSSFYLSNYLANSTRASCSPLSWSGWRGYQPPQHWSPPSYPLSRCSQASQPCLPGCSSHTRLLAESNYLWLVWDLDISKEEKMEECWLATNSTLTSTKLLSFCNSC
jgi:hypothetical protein